MTTRWQPADAVVFFHALVKRIALTAFWKKIFVLRTHAIRVV